ncbi:MULTISPECIES: NAD(P)-dependent oxidoreductase [unclassified Mycobacterium]|uniref:NAD-dependent epimerase/dehydratase family protein n=1 Tax=unclassified Mycobacterium TaxID=2642494 RepID=UPI000FB80EEE|nr:MULTISPECIES: NAD(P)-dependent oxidoreductase [unclassified Mycobacterium]MDP7706020.1 NAD(P)-dependent oxidoreductase [Mycobacterium sp. TY815]MDP7725494.1 NAD(P)-dependent oxidoreductase [Mycobacterium sp. TY814]RUP04474.1 MAG: NAD(P)-dependent oxidoreductase [Mycobacterium sp.]
MSRTTLITGAFGQVGRRCAEILLRRGHTVIAVDLDNEASAAAAGALAGAGHPGSLIVEFADLTDSEAVGTVVRLHQPAAIVHLAAIVSPPSYRNPRLAREVNVGGTRNLVTAAQALPDHPLFVFASSAAVYGSRNPYRQPELITADTPVNPIDQYGEDKVLAERVIAESGLPHVLLRLAAIVSPDGATTMDSDYLVLVRATPVDNRMHAVDARDVALAFANAVERRAAVDGKILVIAGNDTNLLTMSELQDDVMAAVGVGRLGRAAGLPGNPDDDRGWAFTGWFDTAESQALLDYQEHDWPQTVAWVSASMGHRRLLLHVLGPVIRPAMRALLAAQRRREHRGPYADPWTFMSGKYGPGMLAQAR